MIRVQGCNIYVRNALPKLRDFIAKGKYSSLHVLCDENTLSQCLSTMISEVPQLAKAEIIETESGETNKTLEVCAGIWQTLADAGADRQSLIINLGGGVVCDMGGFCASLYKRGIDFVHVPTTLLAMADASIGGKTGVDLLGLKNIVGTFVSPRAVFIEPSFLNTLDVRHIRNGLAEIVKIALVSDARLFRKILEEKNDLNVNALIEESVKLKGLLVEKDPQDKGVRQLLNFGHSTGHALESLALIKGIDVLHGEAVAAGMIIETDLSLRKKLLPEKEHKRIITFIKEIFPQLPDAPDPEELLAVMRNDKKNTSGRLVCTLLGGAGKGKVGETVTPALVKSAVKFYGKILNS